MRTSLSLLAWALLVFCAHSTFAGEVELLSRIESQETYTGDTSDHEITPDGRYVVFQSAAANLTEHPTAHATYSVFWRDRLSRETKRISGTNTAFGFSGSPSMSSDGRLVLYQTQASVPGDSNVWMLVSTGSGEILGSHPANPGMAELSRDGQKVVFTTYHRLVPQDTNWYSDVYVFDARNKSLNYVSDLPDQTAYRFVQDFAVSEDSLTVVFNLRSTSPDVEGLWRLRLTDNSLSKVAPEIRALFTQMTGSPLRSLGINNFSITSDGRFVAFTGSDVRDYVCCFDTEGGGTALRVLPILTPRFRPGILRVSSDGARVVFARGNALLMSDWATETDVLLNVSLSGAPATNGVLSSMEITKDFRYLVYASSSPDLLPDQLADKNYVIWRDLETGTNRLVSVAKSGAPFGDDNPPMLTLTPDGRFVFYDSADPAFGGGDESELLRRHLLMRDMAGDTVELVSEPDPSIPVSRPPRVINTTADSISSDARYVAFAARLERSSASARSKQQIYIHDRKLKTTTLISRNPGSLEPGNAPSIKPMLAANGRLIFFLTYATNLTEQATAPLKYPVWACHDTETGATEHLITDLAGGLPRIDGGITIDKEGRWAAFANRGTTLLSPPPTGSSQVFIRDRLARTNTVRSVNAAGSLLPGASLAPVLAKNGRWLAFVNQPPASPTVVYLVDLQGGPPRSVGSAALSGTSFTLKFTANSEYLLVETRYQNQYDTWLVRCSSSDSRTIITDARQADFSPQSNALVFVAGSRMRTRGQIYIRNMATLQESLVSKNAADAMFGALCSKPAFSPDGRHVVYQSWDAGVLLPDFNYQQDLVLYDVATGVNSVLSSSILGPSTGNHSSQKAIFSPDSSFLLFQSFASDLVVDDYNASEDLFLAKLGGTDSDSDGLDDGWERLHFESLQFSGTDDTDGDGMINAAEFKAGTSPASKESLLQIAIVSRGIEGVSVLWSAVPGKTYRVQKAESLNRQWTTLRTMRAVRDVETVPDAEGVREGYYRILLDE